MIVAITYLIQAGAALFGFASLVLIIVGLCLGNYRSIPLQVLCLAVNVGIFVMEIYIRAYL